MLITRRNGHTESASSEYFPRLRAGTRVAITLANGETQTGVVRVSLEGWLVLVGCPSPVSSEDVRALQVEA